MLKNKSQQNFIKIMLRFFQNDSAIRILSSLYLKHDAEWSEITADFDTNLSKLN